MRMNFWRGVVTGSILGAAISMMTGSNQRNEGISLGGMRKSKKQTRRMLRGVSRAVNDLIK